MKNNFEHSPFPLTYIKTIQFLWDWYNHLKIDNMSPAVLRYIRQFAFFDSHIIHPKQTEAQTENRPYHLSDLPPNSGIEKSGFYNRPCYTDFINRMFQRYMKQITFKLYQANTDILGKQPEILFHLNTNKKSKLGAGILSAQYPVHIIFPLDEIGTLYQTEDQLAATLAHELVHFTIIKTNMYRTITRTEEALADLLGALIMARAGYRPSQNILFFAQSDEKAVSLFLKLQQKKIPSRLTPKEIICLAEVASFHHIKIPQEKMYLFKHKGLSQCDDIHPHPATRMIYLNQLNEYFYKIGLLSEKDEFANGRPIDPTFLNLIKRRQNSIVRSPLKNTHKRYISHRIYFKEKE